MLQQRINCLEKENFELITDVQGLLDDNQRLKKENNVLESENKVISELLEQSQKQK